MNGKNLIVIGLSACLAGIAFADNTNVTEKAVNTNASSTAVMTADKAFYDRKEGVGVFTGHVSVKDKDYILHADKACVFFSSTNELKRVVATGNVALTNNNRYAYGVKATYRHDNGLVVLYGDETSDARVIEAQPTGERVLTGRKIRVWTKEEQIEVVEAGISTPTGNIDPKKLLK